jgi:alpha-aminoadipate carrier protein LysW
METKYISCIECKGNIEVPDDAMVGELLECPDCGKIYEIKEVKNGKIDYKEAEAISEDWGE